nr:MULTISPECIES: GIY-YIG nuclease family protein [Clostridium]
MKDSLDNVIYVGKSKNLKNRVASYFYNSKSHSSKIQKLVKNLKDFNYIVTDTEFEAFILECKLINKLKPTYNKLMKNTKSYSYIQIKIKEEYADINISNCYNLNDGHLYFGPYTNKNTLEKSLKSIKEFYNIMCSINLRKQKSCLNYSLGLCIGMCLDNNKRKDYNLIVNKIINLLKGVDISILNEITDKMNASSEMLDFENALKYRNYLESIKYLIYKAKVLDYAKENKNIILIHPLNNNTFKFFIIKGNKVLFSKKYLLKIHNEESVISLLIENILFHYKNSTIENMMPIEKDLIDESEIIYNYIKNNSNDCKHFVLPEKWLNTTDTAIVYNSLKNLLLSKLNYKSS